MTAKAIFCPGVHDCSVQNVTVTYQSLRKFPHPNCNVKIKTDFSPSKPSFPKPFPSSAHAPWTTLRRCF